MKDPIQTFYNLNFLVDWMRGDVRDVIIKEAAFNITLKMVEAVL